MANSLWKPSIKDVRTEVSPKADAWITFCKSMPNADWEMQYAECFEDVL